MAARSLPVKSDDPRHRTGALAQQGRRSGGKKQASSSGAQDSGEENSEICYFGGEVVMPVQVANLSRSLVTLQLNTGESIHLAPKERSREIDELEIADNPWLDELQRRHLVAVRSVGAGAERAEPARARGRAARTS
jgi:hypothetical protein